MSSGEDKEPDPSFGDSEQVVQLQDTPRRAEQSGINQEKIQEYANELTRLNARLKKNKSRRGDGEGAAEGTPSEKRHSETPATEKLNLLRQQLEQNKLVVCF